MLVKCGAMFMKEWIEDSQPPSPGPESSNRLAKDRHSRSLLLASSPPGKSLATDFRQLSLTDQKSARDNNNDTVANRAENEQQQQQR